MMGIEMATVQFWTGAETKALRQAMRLSVRAFAARLGVDARTVNKWEARGPSITLRPDTQDMLDSALRLADEEVRARFRVSVQPEGNREKEDDTNRREAAKLVGLALAAATQPALDAADQLGLGPNRHRQRVDHKPLANSPMTSWAAAIHEAVLNPIEAARRTTDILTNELTPERLRTAVDEAMCVSLTSDYGALTAVLPVLIGRTEAATINTPAGGPAIFQTLSDTYAVAGWTLIKADQPISAWIAAQRAIHAAEQADDVYRLAAATRCLAEVYMRAESYEEAARTALLATLHLESKLTGDRSTMLGLRGAALLSAAAAFARRGDGREAYAALKAAAVCAAELGRERAALATVFGPTNVAIHQVAIAIELGDAKRAVEHIPAVHLEQMPEALSERRSRFLIDVARSYAQVGTDGAALDALLQAETIAPDELRHHRLTRALVPELLGREQRSSELRALAGRCNVLG